MMNQEQYTINLRDLEILTLRRRDTERLAINRWHKSGEECNCEESVWIYRGGYYFCCKCEKIFATYAHPLKFKNHYEIYIEKNKSTHYRLKSYNLSEVKPLSR